MLDKHALLDELITLASDPWALESDLAKMRALAEQLRSADAVNTYYEQRHANESVRLMRDMGSCPTCGADDPRLGGQYTW